jgi:hypothetical protein
LRFHQQLLIKIVPTSMVKWDAEVVKLPPTQMIGLKDHFKLSSQEMHTITQNMKDLEESCATIPYYILLIENQPLLT